METTVELPPGAEAVADLDYGLDGHPRRRLDLYLPPGRDVKRPVLLWLHGGGWQTGRKEDCWVQFVVSRGYAVAAMNYRLSHDAPFPAPLHDAKAAVRWLRAHAREYNLDGRVIAAGSSAGGHIAAMLGVTNSRTDFEGDVGVAPGKTPSVVAAVIAFYPPTDMSTLVQAPPMGVGPDGQPANQAVLEVGGLGPDLDERARHASPLYYVTHQTPPFLLIHGTNDTVVPYHQSTEMERALRKSRVPVSLYAVPGAGHGGEVFQTNRTTRAVIFGFLQQYVPLH